MTQSSPSGSHMIFFALGSGLALLPVIHHLAVFKVHDVALDRRNAETIREVLRHELAVFLVFDQLILRRRPILVNHAPAVLALLVCTTPIGDAIALRTLSPYCARRRSGRRKSYRLLGIAASAVHRRISGAISPLRLLKLAANAQAVVHSLASVSVKRNAHLARV